MEAGVKVIVQLGYVPLKMASPPNVPGINAVLEDELILMFEELHVIAGEESTSSMVKLTATATSSLVLTLDIVVIVGTSLTALTVTTKTS